MDQEHAIVKRIGYLYEQIHTWENLLLALQKAKKGKKSADLQAVLFNWESVLLNLQKQLKKNSFAFGNYKQFKIFEPKERLINCAPFTDRIVHHAICNIINPLLEKSMIVDSYACRKAKGLHKAVKRAFWFSKQTRYHYRFDIKKYYYTIDHTVLKTMLERKFKDAKLLKLLSDLIDSYHTGNEYYFPFPEDDLLDLIRERGLPIGNLTSQLFANLYLSGLDHLIREKLHLPYYIRYMDDIIVFSDDLTALKQAKLEIIRYLKSIRLTINERKDQIQANNRGVDFLGFRMINNRIKLKNQNLVRLKRKLKQKSKLPVQDFKQFLQSINGHLGYLEGGHTKAIVNHIFADIQFYSDKFKWKMIIP